MIKLQSLEVAGKTVFTRTDIDVPLQNDRIQDDARLIASLPTIQYLLEKGAHIIVAGHVGRPEGKDSTLSTKPIAQWYADMLKIQNAKSKIEETKLGEFDSWKLSENLFILENLRFYPEEEANEPLFAKRLAELADIYVQDAFATIHRNHASIVGAARLLPRAAGLQLQKEVEVLSQVLENPQRPLVVIVGGAKIETKLPLIEKMHQVADFVLIGGKVAFETKTLLKVAHERVGNRISQLIVGHLTEDARNVTKESVDEFKEVIRDAKTVIWNGPLGIDDDSTLQIAQAIIQSRAYSVIGGGDTIEILQKGRLVSQFSFVSTGGGAMLAFLAGEKLPGLEVLQE